MSSGDFGSRAFSNLARTVRLVVAFGAIAWGAYFLPLFAEQATPHRVASAYTLGRGFSNETLLQETRQLAERSGKLAFCDPTGQHDAVVLRLAILNNANSTGSQVSVESARDALYGAIRSSLSCAPSDAFVWLTLYWLDISVKGFKPEDVNYLRLSYTTGPNEGWISLWRVRLALSTLAWLPADVSDNAIDEFVKLVDTGRLYPEMVGIFVGAALTVQSRIVERLKSENGTPRRIFARALYDSGLDVDLPDIEPAHPWQ
jgi:hypothetical protein